MATAYVQEGEVLTLAAPYDRSAGQGAIIGQLFGVARFDVLNGANGEWLIEGVHSLTKAGSQAWTVGANIYWDNSARNCTTTSTSNYYIGVAVEAVGSGAGETIGKVRLNGIGIKAVG